MTGLIGAKTMRFLLLILDFGFNQLQLKNIGAASIKGTLALLLIT